MRPPVEVILSAQEVVQGAQVGILRHCANLDRPDSYGFTGDGWEIDITGALAEMAVAKYLNKYWSSVVDDPWQLDGDVDHQVQIRSSPRDDAHLLLHPKDKATDFFVLVTGRHRLFTIVGWIGGAAGKQDCYWGDPKNTRRPAFWVPPEALAPIWTMPAAIAQARCA